jgi:hypothetical protein
MTVHPEMTAVDGDEVVQSAMNAGLALHMALRRQVSPQVADAVCRTLSALDDLVAAVRMDVFTSGPQVGLPDVAVLLRTAAVAVRRLQSERPAAEQLGLLAADHAIHHALVAIAS